MDGCFKERRGDAVIIKGVLDEDFANYRQPSMFISTATCSFKCEKESGVSCCQNSGLARKGAFEIDDDWLIVRYLSNPITKSIVFGGLEPMDQFGELDEFLQKLRRQYHCDDTVVIYTGYEPYEIPEQVERLKNYLPIVVKFGRFLPNQEKHYDEVLGVMLASPNQRGVALE